MGQPQYRNLNTMLEKVSLCNLPGCRSLFFSALNRVSVTLSLLIYCAFTSAQTSNKPPISATLLNELQPITVGDKVPDVLIENIINFPSSQIRFADLRGKIVLIDFWGTTCSNCIAALPKIDSLQKRYKDKLQVLTVTNYDKAEAVQKTFQRYKKLHNANLPVVLNDVKLKQLFPHEMVSHVIWVDPAGIVKAITGTEYITAANIETVLKGKETNWPVKNDVAGFDYNKPLTDFSQAYITQPALSYSSVFTTHIPGIDGTNGVYVDTVQNTITFNHFNNTLLQYCIGAVEGRAVGYINPKKVIFKAKDPSRYYYDGNNMGYYAEWAEKNSYTYSVTLPFNLSKQDKTQYFDGGDMVQYKIRKEFLNTESTKTFFQTDLSHWLSIFGVKAERKKLVEKCWILVRADKNDELLQSKGGESVYSLNEPGKSKQLLNSGFSNFIWFLNEEVAGIPWVFDETGITRHFKVDMEFKLDSFKDLSEVRKQLKKYGLDLIETKREMDMYVITEAGH